ncbi:hypothetical protein KO317_02820 [Candidatus Micrarchaeota archaeon]|jgi:hypothetical protein|nr:hypothetical protein [Candidatus Micrarchaeota archaeon]
MNNMVSRVYHPKYGEIISESAITRDGKRETFQIMNDRPKGPQIEGVLIAQDLKLQNPPNPIFDSHLITAWGTPNIELQKVFGNPCTVGTGTLIAYPDKGKKLSEYFEYTDEFTNVKYMLRVPKSCLNTPDTAVFCHPRYYSVLKCENNIFEIICDPKGIVSFVIPIENTYERVDKRVYCPLGHNNGSKIFPGKKRVFIRSPRKMITWIQRGMFSDADAIYTDRPPSSEVRFVFINF